MILDGHLFFVIPELGDRTSPLIKYSLRYEPEDKKKIKRKCLNLYLKNKEFVYSDLSEYELKSVDDLNIIVNSFQDYQSRFNGRARLSVRHLLLILRKL